MSVLNLCQTCESADVCAIAASNPSLLCNDGIDDNCNEDYCDGYETSDLEVEIKISNLNYVR